MKNLTSEQIKQSVLDQVYQSCCDDAMYLTNLIEWAYRDYTAEDYTDEYAVMNEGKE